MSTTHNAHRRAFSASRSLKITPLRPALQKGQGSPRLRSLGKRRATEIETQPELDHDDEMTFLQYCPTCEKQIVFPDSSILYCSESCRRKDNSSSNAAMMASTSPKSSPSFSSFPSSDSEVESRSSPRILPARMPSTIATFTSKPPELHAFKADLDPTEWKPDSGSSLSPGTLTTHHRTQSSAAFTYLSQFHRSTASYVTMASRRPGLKSHASTPAVPVVSKTAPDGVGMGTGMFTPAMSAGISSSSDDSTFLKTPDQQSASRLPGLKITGRRSKSMLMVKPVIEITEGDMVQDEDAELTIPMQYAKKAISSATVDELAGSISKLLSDKAVDRA